MNRAADRPARLQAARNQQLHGCPHAGKQQQVEKRSKASRQSHKADEEPAAPSADELLGESCVPERAMAVELAADILLNLEKNQSPLLVDRFFERQYAANLLTNLAVNPAHEVAEKPEDIRPLDPVASAMGNVESQVLPKPLEFGGNGSAFHPAG